MELDGQTPPIGGAPFQKDAFHYRVNTVDAMTAAIEPIPYDLLGKIVSRITNEVPGVNRVLYDLTPKPTGTIEWE